MNSPTKRKADFRLVLECWIWRHGWGILLAIFSLVLMTTGLLVKGKATAEQQLNLAAVEAFKTELAAQRALPPAPVPSSPEAQAHRTLMAVTYSQSEVNHLIRRIHVIAKEHQIAVTESDYSFNTQGFGGLSQQQLTIPLHAKYTAVKAFTMQLLREFPGLSVDQILLHRDDVANGKPEVTIKASLWIRLLEDAPAGSEIHAGGR